jgi:hypothetical protein
MSTSIKYTSPVDSESVILLTKENNWTNIKVYANGGLQYKAEDGDDLRTGRKIEIDGFGMLELHLKSDLEVTLNGTPYEKSVEATEEKVANVSAIFWVLTGFNGLGLLFMLFFIGSDEVYQDILYVLIGLQIFAILVYAATAILLKRGVYWFYFVGAGIYTVFTALAIADFEAQLVSMFSIAALLIRIILLVLVLRIIPVILREMRKGKKDPDDLILDQ